MSFDAIEKKAADENTQLQLKGATKQMRAAVEALRNALRLGGDLPKREVGAGNELDDLGFAYREVQKLMVVNMYRQKLPFQIQASVLNVPVETVLMLLANHFEHEPQFASEWLLREQEVQQRVGPGEVAVRAQATQASFRGTGINKI